jgi:cytochrome c biogenesis protein CcmG, thiol:disulfide interchange protein DsbE
VDADPVVDPETPAGGQGRTLILGGMVVLSVLVIAAIALGVGGGQDQGATPASGGSAPTQPGFGLTDAVAQLPDATLDGFAGGSPVEVADLLGGDPLVLNFWASWCAPCVAEMPELQEFHEMGERRFRLIGINTQDAAPNAERFIEDLGVTYDQVVDRDGSYFTATGSFGMPTTLFVHPDGGVAYRHTGPLTLEQMQDLLATHLAIDLTTTAGS